MDHQDSVNGIHIACSFGIHAARPPAEAEQPSPFGADSMSVCRAAQPWSSSQQESQVSCWICVPTLIDVDRRGERT